MPHWTTLCPSEMMSINRQQPVSVDGCRNSTWNTCGRPEPQGLVWSQQLVLNLASNQTSQPHDPNFRTFVFITSYLALCSARRVDMTFTAMSRICQKENNISAMLVVTVWKVEGDSECTDYSNFSCQRKKTGDSITTGRPKPLGESNRTKIKWGIQCMSRV